MALAPLFCLIFIFKDKILRVTKEKTPKTQKRYKMLRFVVQNKVKANRFNSTAQRRILVQRLFASRRATKKYLSRLQVFKFICKFSIHASLLKYKNYKVFALTTKAICDYN